MFNWVKAVIMVSSQMVLQRPSSDYLVLLTFLDNDGDGYDDDKMDYISRRCWITFSWYNFICNFEATSRYRVIRYKRHDDICSVESQYLWNLSATIYGRDIRISRYLHQPQSRGLFVI